MTLHQFTLTASPVSDMQYYYPDNVRLCCTEGPSRQEQRLNPYQNVPLSSHVLAPSPLPIISFTERQPIRRPLPLHPTSSSMVRVQKDHNTTSSSDSSSEQFEYTRDKLLGAVEKVRSGYLLSRGSPFRHTIEGSLASLYLPV